ncbi:peptidase S41 family protein-like protein [Dothidotthia symphoricarpi CBS 119687]|uniref:Peptidase S41 family protein-like protein n=1 Tax=Dothidotthia symphoricarpi CBS 119687 TaxID=1392245 RepID=A0A6A6ABQ0_9PLEO|nr:peptidase S41 family protein-like protein [Dothidotthia symphoricarpi CBS 119687]KAF2129006.1 peptidase S41 family protein-like protein [Dothidotthia symphoricarpi CBS 119687]
MRTSALLALTGLATLIGAAPSPTRPQVHPHVEARQETNTTSAPCAQVSQFMYGDGTTVVKRQVPAKIAWDCINSVPFNATSAKRLIPAIRPYINWQSTLASLKSPPADYAEKVQPPIDILGGLVQIEADIDAGRFTSEYDFGWTLYTLIQSAHDGHFSYVPDSVGSIFSWGRPMPLVSVSEDGTQLPAVFAFEDVLGLQFKNISYTPSPVVEIDNLEATEFLETVSQYGSLQDRDALYNNVFYELAQVSLADSGSGSGMFTGGGRGRWVYPGATTTLKFANGTERVMENYANVVINFRNVNSGEELGRKWFSWGSATEAMVLSQEEMNTTPTVSTAAVEAIAAAAPGYPAPIVAGPSNLINGFFIDAPGYEDVAVLQVPNFVGISSAQARFQSTTQDFIPAALAAGKTKLIIDLQANGGGTIMQGYDMFKQLFPDIDPYGANRFRATEAADLIGQSYSAYSSQLPRTPGRNATAQLVQSSYFDYHSDMTVDEKPFSSWPEKFGPVEVNGDKYTTPNRWNLSDVYIPYVSGGINVTGYGSLSNVTGPPKFAPENIVLLTDGYCASTCTIFSELMTKQAGVKTIAMGGRSNKDRIQAIGGVKGVNNYQYSYIQSLAQRAVTLSPTLRNSSLGQGYYSDLPFNRGGGSMSINVRDGLALNDTSGIALQFVYEEADCRLYYTPEMTVDITAVWKAAANAHWSDGSKCVSGDYSQKRNAREMTTKLKPRGVHVSRVVALKQVKAFEDSFSLETHTEMNGDGFMQP